jgi:hypothetical protein
MQPRGAHSAWSHTIARASHDKSSAAQCRTPAPEAERCMPAQRLPPRLLLFALSARSVPAGAPTCVPGSQRDRPVSGRVARARAVHAKAALKGLRRSSQRRNSAEHQGRANSPLAVRQRGARQDLRDLARAQPQVRRARRSSAPKTRRMCNCYRGARVRAATHLSLAPRRAPQRGRYAQQMWPRRSVVRSRSTTSAGVPVGPSCAPLPRSPLRKPACCCA